MSSTLTSSEFHFDASSSSLLMWVPSSISWEASNIHHTFLICTFLRTHVTILTIHATKSTKFTVIQSHRSIHLFIIVGSSRKQPPAIDSFNRGDFVCPGKKTCESLDFTIWWLQTLERHFPLHSLISFLLSKDPFQLSSIVFPRHFVQHFPSSSAHSSTLITFLWVSLLGECFSLPFCARSKP